MSVDLIQDGVRTIMHPRLHAAQRSIYRHLVTIQEATETKRPNHEVKDTWADKPLLTSIPCILANVAGDGAQNVQEVKRAKFTAVTEDYRLKLDGLYPAITKGMQAVVKFIHPPHSIVGTYNIIGVDHGSQGDVTRLRLEKVSA